MKIVNEIKFNLEAIDSVMMGLNKVADAVKSTFGPIGRNVIIDKGLEAPQITKDGVTVANSIILEESFESVGANLIKEVSKQTLKDVGDGTTTATILTQAIIQEGLKEMQFGTQAYLLKRGIDKMVDEVVKELCAASKPLNSSDIINIAMVSTNGDKKLSLLLQDVFSKIQNSTVNILESEGGKDYYEITKGISIPSGYHNFLYTGNEKESLHLENPTVIMSFDYIPKLDPFIPIIKEAGFSDTPVVILGPGMRKDLIDQLAMSCYSGNNPVVFIQIPTSTEIQKRDFYDLLGAFQINTAGKSYGHGKAKSFYIHQYYSSFEIHPSNLDEFRKFTDNVKMNVDDRRNILFNDTANIYVSGDTEVEINEKKDRLDDAVHAIKAAFEEGYVQGAGIGLKEVADKIIENKEIFESNDEYIGASIIHRVCQIPYNTLSRVGNTDKIYDPTKVIYSALKNAASIAGLFLTTNCVIVNKE